MAASLSAAETPTTFDDQNQQQGKLFLNFDSREGMVSLLEFFFNKQSIKI